MNAAMVLSNGNPTLSDEVHEPKEEDGKYFESLRSCTSTAASGSLELAPGEASFTDDQFPDVGDLTELDGLSASIREPYLAGLTGQPLEGAEGSEQTGELASQFAQELGRIHRQAQFEIQQLRHHTHETKKDLVGMRNTVQREVTELKGYAKDARADIFDLREQALMVKELLSKSRKGGDD